MICKKCKTAVNEKDKVCSNCGSPINNNKWKIAAGVLTLAAVAVIFALSGSETEKLPEAPEPSAAITQSNEPTSSEDISAQPTESAAVAEPSEETPIPISQADFEKPIDEVWEILDEVLRCINSYYSSYSETVVYISKNGYLYEEPSKSYVFISDLEGLTDIEEKYLNESVMFFYLRPMDLVRFSSLRVSGSDALKIFVGYETRDGFAITAEGEQGGIIAREDLKAALDSYSWNHGNINKVDFDSETFQKVVNSISAYTSSSAGFDVRYMYRDEKYICVVASPKGKPKQISQFILEDNSDTINVRIGNIEAFNRYKKAINDYLPDFNQELMPSYDLSVNLKYLTEDFNNIVEAMLSSSFIADSDLPLAFSSGTSDYVYLEFESGKKFVGHLEQSTWKMYPVDDDDMARELMLAINKKAPVFIVKQY